MTAGGPRFALCWCRCRCRCCHACVRSSPATPVPPPCSSPAAPVPPALPLQAANPGLTVSYTLPVLPAGLTHNGVDLLANAVQRGVRVDVVNVMTMDYGDSAAPGRFRIASACFRPAATSPQARPARRDQAAWGLHSRTALGFGVCSIPIIGTPTLPIRTYCRPRRSHGRLHNPGGRGDAQAGAERGHANKGMQGGLIDSLVWAVRRQ